MLTVLTNDWIKTSAGVLPDTTNQGQLTTEKQHNQKLVPITAPLQPPTDILDLG